MRRLTQFAVILMCAGLIIQFGGQQAWANIEDDASVHAEVYGQTEHDATVRSIVYAPVDHEAFFKPFAITSMGSNDGFLTFKYDDFSANLDKLKLNNAVLHNGTEIRLTDSATHKWGSMFNLERVSLKDDRSFSTYFTFILSDMGRTYSPYTGGDGLVFTVQTHSNSAGTGGGSLGYFGINPSIGIEFDTFPNDEHGDNGSGHHVAVNKNGVTNPALAIRHISNEEKATITDLHEDGKEHHAWVDYDGPNAVLEIRLSGTPERPELATLRVELGIEDRLTTVLNSDEVYVGFTAATGGNFQKHRITSWYFTNEFAPIDVENNDYKQAPAGYDFDTEVLSDGTVQLTITALDGDKSGVPLTITSTNGAAVTPSDTTTDMTGAATVILSSPTGAAITTTITVQDPGGVFPTEVIMIPGRSAPPLPENIVTNATRDQVIVQGVPVDAEVKVYNDNDVMIGSGSYNAANPGVVVISTLPYDISEGDTLYVTFTEKDRIESVKVENTAQAESTALTEDQVVANGTTRTVTVTDVPLGATIIVWNDSGGELGRAVNVGPGTTVVIDNMSLAHGQQLELTMIEVNKLESEPVQVTATWEQSAAPVGILANATKDTVIVQVVPVNAIVTVWNEADVKIGEAKNNALIALDVVISIPGLAKDQQITVRITEDRKLISDPETATAYYELSARLDADQIAANATKNIVVVRDVPPQATIFIYDEADQEIGSEQNLDAAAAADLQITPTPSLSAGMTIKVTVIEPDHDESLPRNHLVLEESDPIPEERIYANADADSVRVTAIPADAEVFIYHTDGDLIGSKKNETGELADLLIDAPMTPMQTIHVTLQESNKLESDFTAVIARAKSVAPVETDVLDIEVDEDLGIVTVTMGNVPAGAEVKIYDESGTKIGNGVNGGMVEGEVEIAIGDPDLLAFSVTYTEINKHESDALSVEVGKRTEQLIEEAMKELEIGYSKPGDTWESVTGNLFVVSVGKHNTIVEWESSNNAVVEITEPLGHTIEAPVTRQDQDVSVILTARVYKNGFYKVRTFLVIVKAKNLVKSVDENEYYREVRVTGGAADEVSLPLKIDRVLMTDGMNTSKIDKVVFDEGEAQLFVADPDSHDETARLQINRDVNDEADEFAVEIPSATLELLYNNGNAVEVRTDYAALLIQHAVMENMVDNYLDLYFRIIPVKDEERQKTINRNVVSENKVKQEAGKQSVEVIGSSLEIETNYAGYPTRLFIPFAESGITVPDRNVDDFLQSLRVFVEHSDGDTAVLTGTPVKDAADNVIGLSIEINKFSVFSIIQLKNRPSSVSELPSDSVSDTEQVTTISVDEDGWTIIIELDRDDYLIDEDGFEATIGGQPIGIEEVEVDGSRILIRLPDDLPEGYTVTISYTAKDSAFLHILKSFADLRLEVPGYHAAYIKGYPDGTFRPDQIITRAEMAMILAANTTLSASYTYAGLYPDVAEAHWAASAIEQLKHEGLLVGDSQGNFRPHDPLTRAEMAVIAARWLKSGTSMAEVASYKDVAATHWAVGAIASAQQADVMIGFPDGTFRPQEYVTRAQAVTTMNRLLGRLPSDVDGPSSWADVPRHHWAFGHIEEASQYHYFRYAENDNQREIRYVP